MLKWEISTNEFQHLKGKWEIYWIFYPLEGMPETKGTGCVINKRVVNQDRMIGDQSEAMSFTAESDFKSFANPNMQFKTKNIYSLINLRVTYYS